MKIATIKDVPLQYRIKQTGVYNGYISKCITCSEPLSAWSDKNTLLGFAEWNGDLIQVHECQKCFKKQYFHVKSTDALETLLVKLQILEEKSVGKFN